MGFYGFSMGYYGFLTAFFYVRLLLLFVLFCKHVETKPGSVDKSMVLREKMVKTRFCVFIDFQLLRAVKLL